MRHNRYARYLNYSNCVLSLSVPERPKESGRKSARGSEAEEYPNRQDRQDPIHVASTFRSSVKTELSAAPALIISLVSTASLGLQAQMAVAAVASLARNCF